MHLHRGIVALLLVLVSSWTACLQSSLQPSARPPAKPSARSSARSGPPVVIAAPRSALDGLLADSARDVREGQWDRAAERLRQAMAQLGEHEPQQRARLLAELGVVLVERNTYHHHDPAAALQALREAQMAAEQAGSKAALGRALHGLGRYYYAEKLAGRGDWETPRRCFAESTRLFQELGDERSLAISYFYMGLLHQWQPGEMDKARAQFQRSLEISARLDDAVTASFAVRHLGALADKAGDLENAELNFRRSIELRRRANYTVTIPFALITLAEFLAERRQRPAEAWPLLEEAIRGAEAAYSQRALAMAEMAFARLLTPSDRPRALEYARRALAVATEFGDAELLGEARKLAAELERR